MGRFPITGTIGTFPGSMLDVQSLVTYVLKIE